MEVSLSTCVANTVSAYKRGDSYYFRVRVGGRDVRRGSYKTADEAILAGMKFQTEHGTGSSLSVGTWQDVLNRVKFEWTRKVLTQYLPLKKRLPTNEAELIWAEDMLADVFEQLKQRYAPSSVAMCKSFLSTAMKEFWRRRRVFGNPCERLEPIRVNNKRIRCLDAMEAAKIHQAGPPHVSDLVAFACQTGLRRVELWSVEWTDIVSGQILVRPESAKGGKPRWVRLSPKAQEVLDRRTRWGKRVWHEFQSPDSMYCCVHRTITKAGIEDFRLHDCRHTFATNYLKAGGRLEVLKELLGHSSIKMTERYSHLEVRRMNEVDETMRRM